MHSSDSEVDDKSYIDDATTMKIVALCKSMQRSRKPVQEEVIATLIGSIRSKSFRNWADYTNMLDMIQVFSNLGGTTYIHLRTPPHLRESRRAKGIEMLHYW